MTTVEYLEQIIKKLERENDVLAEGICPVYLQSFEYGRYCQNETTIKYIRNLIKEAQDD